MDLDKVRELRARTGAGIVDCKNVLVETDFVARTQEFKRFVRDIALQIAASEPIAVSREELPSDVIEREKEIYMSMVKDLKKPPEIVEKIVNGKLEKFHADVCLLEH